MDLGVLTEGESIAMKTWVTNNSRETVTVSTVSTSCECLTASLPANGIAPGARVLARVLYNGANDHGFTGSLEIKVDLTNPDGIKVGRIEVPVEIIRSAATSNEEN
jgi:hypothetical protein